MTAKPYKIMRVYNLNITCGCHRVATYQDTMEGMAHTSTAITWHQPVTCALLTIPMDRFEPTSQTQMMATRIVVRALR